MDAPLSTRIIIIALSWSIAIAAMLPCRKNKKPEMGRRYLYGLCILLLILEGYRSLFGQGSINTLDDILMDIGADFCNQMAIILPVIVLGRLKKLWPAVAVPAIIGGTYVLGYTQILLTRYGMSVSLFQSLLSHLLLVVIPVVMMQTSDFKPEYRHLGKQSLFLGIMIGIAAIASIHFNASFAFVFDGTDLPVIGQLPWPWYWIPLIGLVELSALLVTFILKRLAFWLFAGAPTEQGIRTDKE